MGSVFVCVSKTGIIFYMKIAVIVPTYNEKQNIKKLTSQIRRNVPRALIVVVDDNSPDGTGMIADKLSQIDRKINVVHRPNKLGLGTAYVSGFRHAFKKGYDVVVTMDADLSHSPQVIPTMIDRLKTCDVVIGSRYVSGGKIIGFNAFRTYLSASAQLFSKYLLGLPTHDSSSGFRAYKKKVITKIKPSSIKSQGYSFLIEMIYRCHKASFKICEVPIVFAVRSKGKSKLSQNEIYKALLTVFRLAIFN